MYQLELDNPVEYDPHKVCAAIGHLTSRRIHESVWNTRALEEYLWNPDYCWRCEETVAK